MSCAEEREDAGQKLGSYRRTGPATVFPRPLPVAEALMLALSLVVCLSVIAGMAG